VAVPNEKRWGWYEPTSSCTNLSTNYKVVTEEDYFRRDRELWYKQYYSDFRYHFEMKKPPINDFFKEEIANRPIKYTNIKEKIDPIQAIKFDPENLWS
jgi:hypothetical protein